MYATDEPCELPRQLAAIQKDTEQLGFTMASDARTGAFLRTLAASKPGGRFLELGTGTGLATAWLLDGMDARSALVTVDNDQAVMDIARRHLGSDRRVEFQLTSGEVFLQSPQQCVDLLFADTWAGKYNHLDEALSLVKIGGFYVIDDLLPQPNWPHGHPQEVQRLLRELVARADFQRVSLHWGSGLMTLVRVSA